MNTFIAGYACCLGSGRSSRGHRHIDCRRHPDSASTTTDAMAVDADGLAKVLEMRSELPQTRDIGRHSALALSARLRRPIVMAVAAHRWLQFEADTINSVFRVRGLAHGLT
jgi:hypothetical protein